MDKEKMLRAIRRLRWEANYLKRSKGKSTGSSFLAEVDYLDQDFARAFRDRDIVRGKLLDIGAGLGRQAIEYARLGFEVTATDISGICIAEAARNALALGAEVRFLEDDIANTALTETFDVVTDRGCFTVLQKEHLADYAACVAGLVRPNGFFLLKVDRKKANRIEHLSGRFRVLETRDSSYPSKDRLIMATFFVLQTAE